MPLTLVPTGWFSTKSRKGINSLTGSPPLGAFFGAAASALASAAAAAARPGGGDLGLGIGPDASRLPVRTVESSSWLLRRLRPDPRRPPPPPPPPLPPLPLVALRLIGPRTGTRSTQTHPMCGTGLPPMRRPSSKSHLYSPWNSWKESFDRIDAPTLWAMPRTNASPRPTAPAGGATSSLLEMPASNSGTSFLSMRCPNVASTTTVIAVSGYSSMKPDTASLNCARLGIERPSVAMLEPSTTTWAGPLRLLISSVHFLVLITGPSRSLRSPGPVLLKHGPIAPVDRKRSRGAVHRYSGDGRRIVRSPR